MQYTGPGGVKRRVPLGRWGSLSLDQARTTAKGVLGDVAKGGDPAKERAAAREAAAVEARAERLTLRALLDDWSALGLVTRREAIARKPCGPCPWRLQLSRPPGRCPDPR